MINLDELIDAMHYVHLGRTPLNLAGPPTLRELLKNVTLALTEGLELYVGLCPNNLYLYYEVI